MFGETGRKVYQNISGFFSPTKNQEGEFKTITHLTFISDFEANTHS